MTSFFRVGLVAAIAAATGLGAVIAWPIGVLPPPLIELEGDVNRGAYLARASGCIACHSDFRSGGAPLAGGVQLETPFGAIYSPNLTTDSQEGIGDWDVQKFAVAVRQGISPDGSPYYPAFPYPFYMNFTDQEIVDLWAAFQTVPASDTPSREPELMFPFNQRWGMKLWRAAFLEPPHTDPVPGNDGIWNRGRELVEGAAHCAACHTGRNFAGARMSDTEHFQGNADLPGGDKSPAIDAETLRERGWTVESLAYGLRSGIMPDGDVFGGGMGEVVNYGTSFLTDADRTAIATYLMDVHEGG
ncbi:c-type cytochrome [Parasedimentitalea huanghaiensis]|uniref:C-type cytochrome n=1 Tax=Parasedimentitalea huanghaiensis TaxID=2682100 RepID=A0A6L6WIR1_9RHOB|nr:cytochrome c [Zongyanglinia huanghaiensis]MVO17614.1 c-type cytochrome [Zongyanglinia huanghaiensis]